MKRKTEHNLVFATLVIFAVASAAFIIGYRPNYQSSYQSYKPASKERSQGQGKILGAQSQELVPTGDAFVLSSTASSNYGLAGYLQVSFDRTPNPDVYGRTYIKFNLSSIPTGVTINSASLKFNLKSSGCSGIPTPSALHALIAVGDWQENTITWANAPNATGSKTFYSEICPAADKIISADVTNYIKDWVGGVRPNYGFILRDLNNSTTSYTRYYTSRESGVSGAPKLSITYTTPDASSPSSAGSTGTSSGSTNTSEQGNQGTNAQNNSVSEQGKEGGQTDDKSDKKVNILGKEIKSSTLEAIILIVLAVIISIGMLAFVFRKELADFYRKLQKKKGNPAPKTQFGDSKRGTRLESGKKNVSSRYRDKSGSSGK